MARRSAALLAAIAALSCACSDVGDPRPQLLIVVDTDAAVVGQLAADPTLSADAAIDTVRIDAIDPSGHPYDVRDFIAPEPSDWPLSLGVASPTDVAGGPIRLRIRGFRAALATAGESLGIPTLDPRRETTIDRLVDLTAPAEGIEWVRVVLREDCLGVAASFVSPGQSCVDAARPFASASEGVEPLPEDAAPPSEVGSWVHGREVPCTVTPTTDRLCIPGGVTFLGDVDFVGLTNNTYLDSVPLRPARLSAFLLDRTEFSVGRMRALVASGAFDGELPTTYDPADEQLRFCTWLGLAAPDNDAMPLDCISWEAAARACELEGGWLPSEAQWEHAARGRGQGRTYPWGGADPSCCAASLSRGSGGQATECPGTGLEPIESHPPSAACAGLGDRSRDGIVDLAGSLAEASRDKLRPYDDPCWQTTGIALDPECVDATASAHGARGGYWNSGLADAASALRTTFARGASQGFRCAYRGSEP